MTPALGPYRRLLGYSARYWPLLAAAACGMVLEALSAGAFTWMMRPIVNETFVARNPDVGLLLPLAIVALFLVRGMATFVVDYAMARTGRGVVRDLRSALMAKFLAIPPAALAAEPAPARISRLSYDTEQVAQASAEALKILLTDVLTVLVLLTVMLAQSVKVTLALLLLAPAVGGITVAVSRRYRRLHGRIQEGMASMAAHAEQTLAASDEVRLHGAEAIELGRFQSEAERNFRLHLKVESTRAAASSLVQLAAAAALALVLYLAGREALAGRMDAGQFVALMTAMMAMIPSLKRLASVHALIGKGAAAAERIFAELDQPEEDAGGTLPIERARGELRFEEVGFAFPGESRAVLESVTFSIAPGTVAALVGRSGSGKTTIARLLARFHDPTHGRIMLDGHDLRAYRRADLRRQIAWVGQRVVLFDDSVAANIAYGDPKPDPSRLLRAARAAHALEFIEALPEGFATRLGEGGMRLSGGQRQRIALARAFYRDAPILILDEPSAALDAEAETALLDALEALAGERTVLLIAHRLRTVERADLILVLDRGRIVEEGTHAALLDAGGLYASLYRASQQERSP
ncbi:MAG: lipid A export ATP-binding/permease protein MsbA [Lysobacterales bacterium]|nr:MAG: lipid A export ATP-binding/permease protein MsbA [Xanthomonadales bacterium]